MNTSNAMRNGEHGGGSQDASIRSAASRNLNSLHGVCLRTRSDARSIGVRTRARRNLESRNTYPTFRANERTIDNTSHDSSERHNRRDISESAITLRFRGCAPSSCPLFTVHDPPGVFVFRRPRNQTYRSTCQEIPGMSPSRERVGVQQSGTRRFPGTYQRTRPYVRSSKSYG